VKGRASKPQKIHETPNLQLCPSHFLASNLSSREAIFCLRYGGVEWHAGQREQRQNGSRLPLQMHRGGALGAFGRGGYLVSGSKRRSITGLACPFRRDRRTARVCFGRPRSLAQRANCRSRFIGRGDNGMRRRYFSRLPHAEAGSDQIKQMIVAPRVSDIIALFSSLFA
jgi:hypothetical protein